MKKEKGITLIALIITIIVMLILVAVTINVALNGGLFEKARNASEQTQIEVDREILISAVVGTLDNSGKVYFGEQGGTTGLDNNLPEGFIKTADGRYKNINSNKEYIVDKETGNVELYTGIVSENPWITRGFLASNLKFDVEYVDESNKYFLMGSDGGFYNSRVGKYMESNDVDNAINMNLIFVEPNYMCNVDVEHNLLIQYLFEKNGNSYILNIKMFIWDENSNYRDIINNSTPIGELSTLSYIEE